MIRDKLKSYWHNLTNDDISIDLLSSSNDIVNKENVSKNDHEVEINKDDQNLK